MVRDRVGGWRLAWRFARAGVIAGILVIALTQTGPTSATFDAGQDQLFAAPPPDPRITFIEIDSRTQKNIGCPFHNAIHAQATAMSTAMRADDVRAVIQDYLDEMSERAKRQLYSTQSVFA